MAYELMESSKITGTLIKLETALINGVVHYQLQLSGQKIALNHLVGANISLEYTGEIFCIATQKKIKKSYGQGYSYDAFIKLAECDMCIVKPELCHYSKGTCREPAWGEEHCLKPHIVYLANSSGLKVGITREKQIPTRWMDQGAKQAVAIYRVKDRLTAGLVEVEIAKTLADKTDWRKLIKGDAEEIDLLNLRSNLHLEYNERLKEFGVEVLTDDQVKISYPVQSYPPKAVSLDFEKMPKIEGKLLGMKGQYLLFEFGALNIRKFQGYKINFTA